MNLQAIKISAFTDQETVFSHVNIQETATEYLIAIDLPSFPAEDLEILKTQNGICIEGRFPKTQKRQKILQCQTRGPGIKAIYLDGQIWLKFPKQGALKTAQKTTALYMNQLIA
jgi:HSP20 family molecular chaperone IbpA